MTYWFPASHRGRMMALFMTGIAVSGLIGGPLCGAIIEYLDGYAGFAGWQWLMITTGLPTFIVAAAIYVLLTDRPNQANWLSNREQHVLAVDLGNPERTKSLDESRLGEFLDLEQCLDLFFIGMRWLWHIVWMPTLLSQAGIASNAKIGFIGGCPKPHWRYCHAFDLP